MLANLITGLRPYVIEKDVENFEIVPLNIDAACDTAAITTIRMNRVLANSTLKNLTAIP